VSLQLKLLIKRGTLPADAVLNRPLLTTNYKQRDGMDSLSSNALYNL
jgi:hypothetical protein